MYHLTRDCLFHRLQVLDSSMQAMNVNVNRKSLFCTSSTSLNASVTDLPCPAHRVVPSVFCTHLCANHFYAFSITNAPILYARTLPHFHPTCIWSRSRRRCIRYNIYQHPSFEESRLFRSSVPPLRSRREAKRGGGTRVTVLRCHEAKLRLTTMQFNDISLNSVVTNAMQCRPTENIYNRVDMICVSTSAQILVRTIFVPLHKWQWYCLSESIDVYHWFCFVVFFVSGSALP
jgi:hypothetical protein